LKNLHLTNLRIW